MRSKKTRKYSRSLLCFAFSFFWLFTFGCNPADRLENQEYRTYLDRYQNDVATATAVAAFNQFDTKRDEFNCQPQFLAAQRAAWREKAGSIELNRTKEGRAFDACLEDFFAKSGAKQGLIEMDTLISWTMHNYLPAIKTTLEAEVAVSKRKLKQAGCQGKNCDALVVIGDLAVPRASSKSTISWASARAKCQEARYGGLGPWRLPTKDELIALRESNKLASDAHKANYWSRERSFTKEGTLQAWVLRFDLEAREKNIEPELIPIDRREIASRANHRCVFDVSNSTSPPETEVDEMERTLLDAGCPAENWHRFIRLRHDLVVTWTRQAILGESLDSYCGNLSWCGLDWTVPTESQLETLEADPWLEESAVQRCVAIIDAGPDTMEHSEN